MLLTRPDHPSFQRSAELACWAAGPATVRGYCRRTYPTTRQTFEADLVLPSVGLPRTCTICMPGTTVRCCLGWSLLTSHVPVFCMPGLCGSLASSVCRQQAVLHCQELPWVEPAPMSVFCMSWAEAGVCCCAQGRLRKPFATEHEAAEFVVQQWRECGKPALDVPPEPVASDVPGELQSPAHYLCGTASCLST